MAAEGLADIPAGGIVNDLESHSFEQQLQDAEPPGVDREDSSARIIPQISDDVASGSSQQREELRATPCRDGPGAASASGTSGGGEPGVPERRERVEEPGDFDAWIAQDTFVQAMACYADSCSAAPAWNDWQKVAHRVAPHFDEAVENRGNTGWFSAVRTETMNKRFGLGWKAKAFRSAVRPESKEDMEAALRREGPTAASARGTSAESGVRERGRAQGRSGAPSRGVSRESRQSHREASGSRASSRAGAISPELNDIWIIGEEGSQERRAPSPAVYMPSTRDQ